MRSIFTILFGLATISSIAQVVNEVQVYVKPGTEVHVFEDMTNSSTGNFTVGDEGLLYVDGTLINNGSMTFNNASSLLRGSTGNDGTGSGTYYVRRQGATSASIFNYWSSPMQSYSGVPGGANYLYDPTLGTQTYTDDQPADPGWVSYDGLMTPGRGYAGRGGGLATFSGDVNNGNVNYSLFYTPDIPGNAAPNTPFNLVGNPYPSGVSCASLVLGNSDISGALYFWDDDLSGGSGYSSTDYAVWNGTGSLGTGSGSAGVPNGVISSGQGFKVKAISPGAVLNFTNSMRVANTTQFFRVNGDNSRLWFSIEGNNHFNQILIGVLDDATDGEDRLYDATKIRGNGEISLAAMNDGKDYCIMAFPPPHANKMVPLNVFVNNSGNYTFSADRMESFNWQTVAFVDLENHLSIPLHEGLEIPMYIEAGEYTDRFYLNFGAQNSVGIPDREETNLMIYSYGDDLFVGASSITSNTALVELYDLNGKLVLSESNVTINPDPTRISLAGLANGVYITRLMLNEETFNSKIIKQ
ncbi:MAG: T9SS type A sorting domain-containing protein [Flavobacteriales bacterium]|nr:T9SS type A sorting domain-containing protein [Flavobacteriales bacterium]